MDWSIFLVVVLSLSSLFIGGILLVQHISIKLEQYKYNKKLSKVNPYNLKVGNRIQIDKSFYIHNYMTEGRDKITSYDLNRVVVDGWCVPWEYVLPAKSKIYLGGE